MKLSDTIGIALKAIRSNALRSILTTLGIIIGVASLIVMVAIGSGARADIEERLESLGTNMLTMRPGASRFGGRSRGAGSAELFTDADVEAIRDLPNVVSVSGYISAGSAAVVYESSNWTTRIEGVGAEYGFINDWEVDEGFFFTEDDVRTGKRYALIGDTVKQELFGGASPIGSRIRIRNVPFEIIGVMKDKGDSGGWRDQDDVIFAPLTAVRSRLVGRNLGVPNAVMAIYVKVRSIKDIPQVTLDLTNLMRDRRRLAPGADNDFNIFDLREFIEARTETFRLMTMLLGVSAAIVLVVGGISIMNIMLVSVTERTREIGLRMAVGARPQAILTQFLTEAVTLCLIGGLVGVGLGVGVAWLVSVYAGWEVLLSPLLLIMALATAAAVGIVFGYFPARRAAQLNPIDALRYE